MQWDLLLKDYNEAKEYIEDVRDICDDFEGLCQRNLAANTGTHQKTVKNVAASTHFIKMLGGTINSLHQDIMCIFFNDFLLIYQFS